MEMGVPLPGGAVMRSTPAGLASGATRSHIQTSGDALALVADELLAAEAALLESLGSDVGAIAHVSRYLAQSGGKRLRPALVALSAHCLGVSVSPQLMCAGELVHLGSLLHDDIVDEADARRGQATANQVYGNAIAVLSGDFCVGRALRLAFQEGGGDCALRLAATVEEMAEGEVLQLQRAGQVDADRAGYLEVANRKSASLIAWCAMAPALRDGLAEEAAALEAYGRNVGLAFQVADDILDFSPDTGKTPGADLRERKVTLPILHAFERLPTLKDRLRGELSDADILELVDEVVASGALEAAREEAFRWIAEARQALQALPEGPGRDALDAVAGFVAERMK